MLDVLGVRGRCCAWSGPFNRPGGECTGKERRRDWLEGPRGSRCVLQLGSGGSNCLAVRGAAISSAMPNHAASNAVAPTWWMGEKRLWNDSRLIDSPLSAK